MKTLAQPKCRPPSLTTTSVATESVHLATPTLVGMPHLGNFVNDSGVVEPEEDPVEVVPQRAPVSEHHALVLGEEHLWMVKVL